MTGEPLPARILIPVANPLTAEELIRIGAALLEPRTGELSALGIGGENDSGRATTAEMAEALAGFHFPDDLWARVIYDLVIATRRGAVDSAALVAALVPIYFGRVGSFVVENRHVDTADAEERVERQAREFELLKPYLVERWKALDAADLAADAAADAAIGPTTGESAR